jgi:hypothetical protein
MRIFRFIIFGSIFLKLLFSSTVGTTWAQVFPGSANGCYKNICFEFDEKATNRDTTLMVQACDGGMEDTSFEGKKDKNGNVVEVWPDEASDSADNLPTPIAQTVVPRQVGQGQS